LLVIERPFENLPAYDEMTSATEELQPQEVAKNSPEEELARYYAFIAQLPPPTLSFDPLTENSTPAQTQTATPTAPTEETKSQRMYQDVYPSGEVRTVLEQQSELGNGRRWRRKLIVYSGGSGAGDVDQLPESQSGREAH
jgi:hypothetical protein